MEEQRRAHTVDVPRPLLVDGGGGVEGWNDASETFAVTLELVRRGYTEEEIAKLWGENLLRVLDEVQRIASEIQSS